MKTLTTAIVLALSVVAAHAQRDAPSTIPLPVRLTGAVISAGGVGNPTGTGRVEIALTRWSSPEEQTLLTEALVNQGEDALLDELSKARSVGTIRFNTQLAYDLRYAKEFPEPEGGHRLILATDRPMGAWEVWNHPQYARYPFTLIELRLSADGGGTGSLLLAARLTAGADGRFVHVENFATEPIRITGLRLER